MSAKDIPNILITTLPNSVEDENTQMPRSVDIDVGDQGDASDIVQPKQTSRPSSSRSMSETDSPPSAAPATLGVRGRVVQFADRVRITSGIRSAHAPKANLVNSSTSTPRSTSRSSSISDTASSMSVPLRPPAETTPHAYAQTSSISGLSTVMNSEDANAWLNGPRGHIGRQKRPKLHSQGSDNVTERTPLVTNSEYSAMRCAMSITPQDHDGKSPCGPKVLSSEWWRTKWEQCCSCFIFIDDENRSI